MNRNMENMVLDVNGFTLRIRLLYSKSDQWFPLRHVEGEEYVGCNGDELTLRFSLRKAEHALEYSLELKSAFETGIRLEARLVGEEGLFHLIPCNIYGNNNFEGTQAGEFPVLTDQGPDDVFCSEFWEFRADRSSHPVSILCCKKGAVGISIDPYVSIDGAEPLRNGVFAGLPDIFGVSLGYTNDPVTFIDKRKTAASTCHRSGNARTKGRIYAFSGRGRQNAHDIAREIYKEYREVPRHRETADTAARALLDRFVRINWSKELQQYSNLMCHVPEDTELKSWRPLVEIGWTGGAVLAYPFLLAESVLNLEPDTFSGTKNGRTIFQEIVDGFNEKSGMLNDVTRPWDKRWPDSRVNGWWSGFGLAVDCHCAYTNGSAVYYLLKACLYLKKNGLEYDVKWLEAALKVLHTVVELQRQDGAFGYLFSTEEKKVLDWDGFAGCWFTAALPYAYLLTGDSGYLAVAEKAMEYYDTFVIELNCFGTPMDTWKSVDEEGNLAFIRAARLLHEITGEAGYLDMLERGAAYEYLWKYCFRAIPEFPPLKGSSWNSCGASVTSISNPHTHPMGMLVVDDLDYLARQTGNSYHQQRVEDSIAWLLNTMELYPSVTGYGEYGVLSERFCPSDGLIIERFSNGEPSSTWFTYNGWAAANALECLLHTLIRENRLDINIQ